MISYIQSASAYIDPGTGGMIVGGLWPVITGALALAVGLFIKYLLKPTKKSVADLWKKIRGKT
ncbi:MAG: hypothetical protein V1921_00950 [Candidatus Altiarchaeota archaeon]